MQVRKILVSCPEPYAPPGGTGLAARRHHIELDFCVVASISDGTGLQGNRFVLLVELELEIDGRVDNDMQKLVVNYIIWRENECHYNGVNFAE